MTIEIAAWVLTGCLLACVYFMIVQERRHRKKVIDLEIQLQTAEDRVTSLTSLTDDIQASLRRQRETRAGTSPANPDAVVQTEHRGWGRALEDMMGSLQGAIPAMQSFSEHVTRVQTSVSGGVELPDDWQKRLMSPEAVEGLEPEPRSYEVGDEPVIANGTTYDPGTLIPVEVVAHLPPDHVRKFLDAQLITPSLRDPRPTRYDRLTEDDD